MNSTRFDDLTKALATPTSRRQALWRIGGTLTGAVLASWPLSQVFAKGGGNSACAHFCDAVFGADTPAADQCISDAAHGKGLCYTCGSAAPSSLCCSRNASGYCSSYSSATCCDSGATCLGGSCCANVCGSICCPSGQACQNGQCVPTYPYTCFCKDSSEASTCSTTTCDLATLDVVCGPLCANNGGFQGSGYCSSTPC